MKVHLISESKQEWTIPPATATEAKEPANYKKIIKHHFGAVVIDPPSEVCGIGDHFNIPAEALPAAVKIGDDLIVYFELVK